MDLFKLVAKLGLDSSAYEKGLSGALNTAKSMAGAIGKGMAVIGGATATAVGAVGAGVATLAKQATSAYAEYEQLEGGIETLFGESAPAVMKQASEAYKTAGMSMNQYMETSIQSAAAMINSLGGDQAKAAELMNVSITDMADNVNKMGTTMEAVQNAYKGFSRGNFTMLDNLALGFAGTKEGMQELLDKAEQLSGVKFNIDNYSDIVQAIHIVQEEMGISGTTMKEAGETISGSLGAVKGAWENLIAGIANENANLPDLMGNLVDAIFGKGGSGGFLNNILPRVEQALTGISELVIVVADQLPGIAGKFVPQLVGSFVDTITKVIDGISSDSDQIISNMSDLFNILVENALKLITAGVNALPIMADIAISLITTLASGIIEAVPQLIPAAMQALMTIVGILVDNIGLILEAAVTIITTLASALAENVDTIVNAALTIVLTLVDTIMNNIGQLLDVAVQIVVALADSISQALPELIPTAVSIVMQLIHVILQNLDKIVGAALDILMALVEGILTALPQLDTASYEIIFELIGAIIRMLPKIIETAITVISEFVGYLVDTGIRLINGDIFRKLLDALVDVWKSINWGEIGANIIEGIIEGITKGWDLMKDAVSGVVQKIKDVFIGGFEIHSPSKVFENYGKMIDEGLAIGISSGNMSEYAMEGMSKRVNNAFGYNPEVNEESKTINIYFGNELFRSVVVDALNTEVYISGGR